MSDTKNTVGPVKVSESIFLQAEVSTVPTDKQWIGGTALGYKIFWDEVPPKTQAFDEANKLVIAPGPLTGTGAVCSGRTSITTMYPTTYPRHWSEVLAGGDIGAKLNMPATISSSLKVSLKNPFISTHQQR